MDEKNLFSHFFEGSLPLGNDKEDEIKKETISNNSSELISDSDFSEEELSLINQEVLDQLKNNVPPNKFRTFFEKTFALNDLRDGVAIFVASTNLLKRMILNSYKDQLICAISETLGEKYEVEINVSEVKTDTNSNKNNILHSLNQEKNSSFYEKTKIKQPKFTLSADSAEINAIKNSPATFARESNIPVKKSNPSRLIDTNKNFSNFISGSSNNLAFASAYAIAKNPGNVENSKSLYIYSDPGLGKTHLLHAIANKVNEEHPNLVVFFVSASDFIDQFIEARMQNSINDFMDKYTKVVDILMIDDIHGLGGKEGTQDIFFQIFNSLYDNKKQLIFTSDKKPKDIIGIPERLKSRLQWGLTVDIQRPDYETRITILNSYASQKNVFIPDNVTTLMASAQTESIRELEGFINLLSHVSSIEGIPIDLNLAKKYLKLEQTKVKKITAESITKAVASQMRLNIADIKSSKRTKDLATARHISMFLIKKHTQLTLKEIGGFFDGRNHSTVITSIDKIHEEIKINLVLSEEIMTIEKKIH